MGLLGKLKKKEVARTVYAVAGHPALTVSPEGKDAYLSCVCIMSYADEVLNNAEQRIIRDLAESLDFSTEELPSIFEFASEPDEKTLEKKVSIVAELNMALPCLADMAFMAYADGHFCEETEEHYLRMFAKEWNVDENSLSQVMRVARAIYGGRFDCVEGELKKKWSVAASEMELLRSWVSALKTTCIPHPIEQGKVLAPSEKRSVAIAEPIASKYKKTRKTKRKSNAVKATAQVARIDSFKVDVLSQLGKLNQLLENVRMDGGPDSSIAEFQGIADDLQSEVTKVSDLRMTLAFVGTMKAGKSTTINAIVGSNVLPNRSGAMTTLPTLITHTQGNTEPVLNFIKKEPFDDAIAKIKEFCEAKRIKEAPKGVLFRNTLDRIISKRLTKLRPRYKGQKEIYSFMESMNDIARICSEFELETPLASYTSVGDFPEIEVEFAYLADREGNCAGKLSLVDTPGPNEAGQGGLKGVVKEQLAKASAIVCVAEPTQVDSEAQAEIRDWIQGAQKTSGAPLFVLLNKIDTMPFAERNSDIFAERALRLFPDFDDREGKPVSVKGRVYGISSHQALLANRASYSLRIDGCLPHWENDGWVMDFLEKGGWVQDDPPPIEDTNWVADRSQRLWVGSKMQQPMDEIILHSMHQAVPLCLGHALDFIGRNISEVHNAATVRQGALGVEVKELDALVQNLESSITKINSFQQELSDKGVSVLGNFKKKLEAAMSEIQVDAMVALKKNSGEKNEKGRIKSFYGIQLINYLQPAKRNLLRDVLFGDEVLTFDDKSGVNELITKVADASSTVIRKVVDHSLSECESFLEEKKKGFAADVGRKIEPILDEINTLMSVNFDFSMPAVRMPATKLVLDLDIAVNSVAKEDKVDRGDYKRTWYTFWIGKKWVPKWVNVYKIAPCDLRQEVDKQFAEYGKKASELIHKTTGNQFRNDLSEHINAVNSVIARVQSSIEQAVNDKGQAEETQEKTRKYFAFLAEESKKLGVRTCKVKGALNNIMEGE